MNVDAYSSGLQYLQSWDGCQGQGGAARRSWMVIHGVPHQRTGPLVLGSLVLKPSLDLSLCHGQRLGQELAVGRKKVVLLLEPPLQHLNLGRREPHTSLSLHVCVFTSTQHCSNLVAVIFFSSSLVQLCKSNGMKIANLLQN